MKPVNGPGDVKPGDKVSTRVWGGSPMLVVKAGADKLTVLDGGKKRALKYTRKEASDDWRRVVTTVPSFYLLDERDLWLAEQPASPLGSYLIEGSYLLSHFDYVIAELTARREWLLREPAKDAP